MDITERAKILYTRVTPTIIHVVLEEYRLEIDPGTGIVLARVELTRTAIPIPSLPFYSPPPPK